LANPEDLVQRSEEIKQRSEEIRKQSEEQRKLWEEWLKDLPKFSAELNDSLKDLRFHLDGLEPLYGSSVFQVGIPSESADARKERMEKEVERLKTRLEQLQEDLKKMEEDK
jgi:DNA repair exonuclease SbcCD ATPase subunit